MPFDGEAWCFIRHWLTPDSKFVVTHLEDLSETDSISWHNSGGSSSSLKEPVSSAVAGENLISSSLIVVLVSGGLDAHVTSHVLQQSHTDKDTAQNESKMVCRVEKKSTDSI